MAETSLQLGMTVEIRYLNYKEGNMKSFEEMTTKELELENVKLMQAKNAIREKKLDINKILNDRVATDEAARKVAAMSESQRAAYRQVLSPKGIKSEEKLGK